MLSNNSSTEPGSPLNLQSTFMEDILLMAKKSLNMIEKMMDPNIIDYYIINYLIPSIMKIENRYRINFGKPVNKVLIAFLRVPKTIDSCCILIN